MGGHALLSCGPPPLLFTAGILVVAIPLKRENKLPEPSEQHVDGRHEEPQEEVPLEQ